MGKAKKSILKIGPRIFSLIKHLYPLAIITIIIVLCLVGFFLYQNVYKTLSQAEILTALKKEASEQSLENKKFQEILDNVKEKTKLSASSVNQRDVFQILPTRPNTPSASSTPAATSTKQ